MLNSSHLRIYSGKTPSALSQENEFSIGDKQVEFDRVLSPDEYLSGACFTTSSNRASFPVVSKMNVQKQFVSLVPSRSTSNLVQTHPVPRDIAQPINANATCCFWRAELYDIVSLFCISEMIIVGVDWKDQAKQYLKQCTSNYLRVM